MSYQVIARKYRPQRFSDVVGQEHVSQTLTNAIEQKRIAHAYLFCGPRGTGKTTLARIFAKCLNATDGPKVDFDDADPRCVEIAEGRSLDVMEIDGASNNGVEQVRDLRETCKYAPASSKFKIYIIDEVHMLTTAAFNALLKTLEEPPAHVKFMFATTEPEKVLPTILSRCQRFDLRRIPQALIVKHLTHIAKLENVEVEPAALQAIARGAEGGMRDAESALDQLISFCGGKIVESDVLSMFGLTAQGQILSLSSAVLKGDAEKVLRELNELSRHGKDLGRFLADLLGHMRNLLIYQVSKGDLKLIEASEADATSLKEESALVSTEALTRILDVLTDCESRLRDAASKKIFVEVAMLKAIQAREAVQIDAVLKQLHQLRAESRGASGGATTTAGVRSAVPERTSKMTDGVATFREAPANVAPAVPQTSHLAAEGPAPAAAQAVGAAGGEVDLGALWQNLLEAVGRASPFTRSYLVEAHPVSLSKNVLTVGYDPEFRDHVGLVNNQRAHALLQTKLQELGHPNVQIKFILDEDPVRAAAPAPASEPTAATPAPAKPTAPAPIATATSPPPKAQKATATKMSAEDFKNDPLIQKALEVFKGQIVEVRA
jgi:DNA polymerase-3 subunit gamma/tau